jgi:hypothetical protein
MLLVGIAAEVVELDVPFFNQGPQAIVDLADADTHLLGQFALCRRRLSGEALHEAITNFVCGHRRLRSSSERRLARPGMHPQGE